MFIATASPGTPPELTDSQSSKSSSNASQSSSPDDFGNSTMNFEDINLDDETHKTELPAQYPKTRNQSLYATKNASRRPALATLQTQQTANHKDAVRNIKSASATATRSAFTTPTLPSFNSRNSQRTRSESPTLHKTRSASRLAQFAQTPATSLGVPGRRGSWQPARKTIYEIEAEYHDSDDELPDDASLFNVPVSTFHRYPSTTTVSTRSSTRASPERGSPISPAPIPLNHAFTAPDMPPYPRKQARAPAKKRTTLRIPPNQLHRSVSAVVPSSLPEERMRYGRTRSWNLVMADLDHESRIIAEKLDFHQEVTARLQATSITSYRSSAPGAIPLPPIQKSTLDFMPVSKEKEAVLSRTRPSWLPPKDPKEEKRHLEEYTRMMKASIEADKRREQKTKRQPCFDDNTRESLQQVWRSYVEPASDVDVIEQRVRDLSWSGIPSKLRGLAWQRRVGNPLALKTEHYTFARERVEEIKSKPVESLTDGQKVMQEWFADIERDAETAFPDINLFRKNGARWLDLINLCEAYTWHRGNLGYSYGLQLMAAVILLQTPQLPEAFMLLANCLNRTTPHNFQIGDTESTSQLYSKVKSMLNNKFSELHAYLFDDQEIGGLGFRSEELFASMFSTIFANGLDLDRICRVWDIWIFEDDHVLVRTAVALLGALQSQIFDVQGDIHLRRRNIQEMLVWGPFNRTSGGYWNLAAHGNGDTFIEDIRAAGRLDYTGR